MALAIWNGAVTDAEGNIVPGAPVEVRREGDGRLAQLFSDRDGTNQISNPTTADENGKVTFHAIGGAYRITPIGSDYSRRFEAIGTAQEMDFDDLAFALEAGVYPASTKAVLDEFELIEGQTLAGVVYDDPDASLNGYYLWNEGNSEWVRQRGLPDTMANLTIVGGTANAIEADGAPGVDPGSVVAFFIDIDAPNEAGPVTISINSGTPVPVLDITGAEPPEGALRSMMFLTNMGSCPCLGPDDQHRRGRYDREIVRHPAFGGPDTQVGWLWRNLPHSCGG